MSPPAIGRAEAGGRPRVVLLPIDNVSGAVAPTKELLGAIAQAFGDAVEVVQGDELEPFLTKHRIRHTGGLDPADARAARDELGADAVLITGLSLYRAFSPPMHGAHRQARVHRGRAGHPLDGLGLAIGRPGARPAAARDRGSHRGHPEPGRGRARARPPRVPRRDAARRSLPDRRPPRPQGPVPVGGARRRGEAHGRGGAVPGF